MNNFLQAIDAQTGKSILTFGDKGLVDLKMGLGRDGSNVRAQSSTPGKIFENLIMLGSSVGEGYLSPPGHLRAFDVVTGKLAWTFHTIPQPGEFGYDTWPKDAYKYAGGANTWGEISVDAQRGIAYFPTGSPTYDYYGADRIGANLFGNCLLALDARTGKRLWHFQTVHHDLWDYDSDRRAAAHHRQPQRQERSTPSRRRPSTASCSCSIASRASRCFRSKSGRCRRAMCLASKPGRRSRFRPCCRRSPGRR